MRKCPSPAAGTGRGVCALLARWNKPRMTPFERYERLMLPDYRFLEGRIAL
jgi:hypothetical protein